MSEDLDQDRETGAEQANCASINLEQTMVDAETRTVNPERKVETQTVATQTDEFEYLYKETVVQPFTEEYFVNNEDRVRFYTGLHGFDVLKATFDFVSPFVTRRSKTLSLFQEFIMVLMKLRLNVPLQDLQIWCVSSNCIKNLYCLVDCYGCQIISSHQMARKRGVMAYLCPCAFSSLLERKLQL